MKKFNFKKFLKFNCIPLISLFGMTSGYFAFNYIKNNKQKDFFEYINPQLIKDKENLESRIKKIQATNKELEEQLKKIQENRAKFQTIINKINKDEEIKREIIFFKTNNIEFLQKLIINIITTEISLFNKSEITLYINSQNDIYSNHSLKLKTILLMNKPDDSVIKNYQKIIISKEITDDNKEKIKNLISNWFSSINSDYIKNNENLRLLINFMKNIENEFIQNISDISNKKIDELLESIKEIDKKIEDIIKKFQKSKEKEHDIYLTTIYKDSNNNYIYTNDKDLSDLDTDTIYKIGFYLDNSEYKAVKMPKKIKEIKCNFPNKINNTSHMFEKCTDFNQDISNWNTSNVTDMSHMFENATSFNSDITNWDTTKVTNMSYMFSGAIKFNNFIFNLNWNSYTKNVTDMSHMFENATSFNRDISKWDTTKVTNMSHMFSGATSFNQNINTKEYEHDTNGIAWNTSKVTNMSHMFDGATIFNQNIAGWDVRKVTNTSYMFANATSFNDGDNNNFNWNSYTYNVTDMSHMFENATSFNSDISKWDTTNVTNMSYMFSGAKKFNQNINTKEYEHDTNGIAWNTSNVTNMQDMFYKSDFKGDVSNWNTSNVTNMRGTFAQNNDFNSNISTKKVKVGNLSYDAWNVSKVTDMSWMFELCKNFNQDISNWDVSLVKTHEGFDTSANSNWKAEWKPKWVN